MAILRNHLTQAIEDVTTHLMRTSTLRFYLSIPRLRSFPLCKFEVVVYFILFILRLGVVLVIFIFKNLLRNGKTPLVTVELNTKIASQCFCAEVRTFLIFAFNLPRIQ